MQDKTVIISGCDGQIASYLTEYLLPINYKITGLIHRSVIRNLSKHTNLSLVQCNIEEQSKIADIIKTIQPSIFVNCAAQSNNHTSFQDKEHTMKATGHSVSYMLEAIKKHSPNTKFIQLGSAEMFDMSDKPLNELSPMKGRSPYSEAKIFAHNAVIEARKEGLFASNCILFNSESPRRPDIYVSRKITKNAAMIKNGLASELVLGNVASRRSFLFAKDTANAIFKIMEHSQPDDFVVSSDDEHSIYEFAKEAFSFCELNVDDYLRIDQSLFRKTPENVLQGDATKIKTVLGWKAECSFRELVKMMVESDLELIKDMK